MYCGSCLRDNSLARALMKQGHEVILVPLYTPTRTDEPNVSQGRVFFGGIGIYLAQRLRFFRHTPRFLDKLWDAPAVIRAFAGRGIEVDPGELGALTVSMLEGSNGRLAKEFGKLVEWLREEPPPDVVTLPYTLLIGLARPLREAVRRPVICTLQGEELFLENLTEPDRTRSLDLIRKQTAFVDRFIAVSNYEARFMTGYLGIPEAKISVVPLGIDVEGFGPGQRDGTGEFRIGYLARIAPEKGLHLLADAYVELRRSGVRATLEAAGYLALEHRSYLEGVKQKIAAAGLEFHYLGEVDRAAKIAFLQSLDVLSVPCTYDEPKGLFVLEAMACGVPVVLPRRGAFPEMVEAAGGGMLVEPSAEALARAFSELAGDRARARVLGMAGHEAVHRGWRVEMMARRTAEVYAMENIS